jgi:hypothetical protein
MLGEIGQGSFGSELARIVHSSLCDESNRGARQRKRQFMSPRMVFSA